MPMCAQCNTHITIISGLGDQSMELWSYGRQVAINNRSFMH